jgi:molybdate transport repressor ModE-like protein
MSLTLRQLKYFSAVAEVGRISHAALQLNISQSAVTTAIRELEEMMGQQLFERHPHGVELTKAGRRFLSHAYAVLSAADEAIRMPHEGANVEGSLTIAASYTVLGYFLPHHLQRFEQLHPQVTVKVHEVAREAIEEGLITQSYDMGVVLTSNVVLRELSLETFFGSPRRLWVPAKHPLLEKAEVTLADVAAEPYIMLTVRWKRCNGGRAGRDRARGQDDHRLQHEARERPATGRPARPSPPRSRPRRPAPHRPAGSRPGVDGEEHRPHPAQHRRWA